MNPNDLDFVQFKAQAARALTGAGYTEAAPTAADLKITLAFGVSDPRTDIHSAPTFGQVGAVTTTTTASRGPVGALGGTVLGNTTTTTYTQPPYDVASNNVETRTTYSRFARVSAYDAHSGGPEGKDLKEVWRTTVTSPGRSGDLRQVFPVLMAAGQPYFGKETQHQIEREFDASNPTARMIAGGNVATR